MSLNKLLVLKNKTTVRFSVKATDGIDTVNITGEDRVVYVNRYDYLSTDDIQMNYIIIEADNNPNPFQIAQK